MDRPCSAFENDILNNPDKFRPFKHRMAKLLVYDKKILESYINYLSSPAYDYLWTYITAKGYRERTTIKKILFCSLWLYAAVANDRIYSYAFYGWNYIHEVKKTVHSICEEFGIDYNHVCDLVGKNYYEVTCYLSRKYNQSEKSPYSIPWKEINLSPDISAILNVHNQNNNYKVVDGFEWKENILEKPIAEFLRTDLFQSFIQNFCLTYFTNDDKLSDILYEVLDNLLVEKFGIHPTKAALPIFKSLDHTINHSKDLLSFERVISHGYDYCPQDSDGKGRFLCPLFQFIDCAKKESGKISIVQLNEWLDWNNMVNPPKEVHYTISCMLMLLKGDRPASSYLKSKLCSSPDCLSFLDNIEKILKLKDRLSNNILNYYLSQRIYNGIRFKPTPRYFDYSIESRSSLDALLDLEMLINSQEELVCFCNRETEKTSFDAEQLKKDVDITHKKWFVTILDSKVKGNTDLDKTQNKVNCIRNLYKVLKDNGKLLSCPNEDLFIYRFTGLMRDNKAFNVEDAENRITLALSNVEIGYILRCLISDDRNDPIGLSNGNQFFVSKNNKSMNMAAARAYEIKDYEDSKRNLPAGLCRVVDMLLKCGFMNVEKMYSKGERGKYKV